MVEAFKGEFVSECEIRSLEADCPGFSLVEEGFRQNVCRLDGGVLANLASGANHF